MSSKIINFSKIQVLLIIILLFSNAEAQSKNNIFSELQGLITQEKNYFQIGEFEALKLNKQEPSIFTQKRSYAPAETMQLVGDEFESFEMISISVSEINEHTKDILINQLTAYADGQGRISISWDLDNSLSENSDFVIVAKGASSGKSTRTYFSTESLAGETISQLTQCANGSGLPQGQNCPENGATGWVSGNVGASKSQYIEGDSISYRVILDNLDVGDVYEYTFGWDVTKGGLNAIDYLTTYDRSISGANPCKGTRDNLVDFHCTQGSPTSVFPIPLDPIVAAGTNRIDEGGSGDDVSQVPGVLTMWGGQLDETVANCSADVGQSCGLSSYVYTDPVNFPAGDESASITLTFKATNTKMVLAWGGHIATREDWGRPNGSVNITGSPYHMFNMSGNNLTEATTNIFSGNREVQLSTASISPVGRLIIYKHASPATSMNFNFSGDFTTNTYTSGTVVSLQDNNSDLAHSPGGANSFAPATDGDDPSWIVSDIADYSNTLTVTESPASGYSPSGINCAVTDDFENNNDTTFPSGSSVGSGISSMAINLGKGDEVTCTFFNSFVTAADLSLSGRVLDMNGIAIGGAVVTMTDSNGISRSYRTNHFGFYHFEDIDAGSNVLMNVSHKSYQFSPQFLTLHDSLNSFEIFAN